MNREQIITDVRPQMPEARWLHTEGVMATAKKLAELYGEDSQRAEMAAIIHDVAKYWSVNAQAEYIEQHQLNTQLLQYDKELWHAEIGAHLALHKYEIKDEQIGNAIRYHTSGRANMSKLEKIVWLADYIEPTRAFPGVEIARELAEQSLEKAILFGLDQTLTFLINKGKVIYPKTMEARNDILKQIKQEA